MAQLNRKEITDSFSNVVVGDDDRFEAWRVLDQNGSDKGMISYLGENEWRVFVDNFPSPKKYFAWNIPTPDIRTFESYVRSTGLNLITSGNCPICKKDDCISREDWCSTCREGFYDKGQG